MASQQAYPSYGSSSTSQQSYPVPRPTSSVSTTLVVPADPIPFLVGSEVEVAVDGVMDYDITNPPPVE